MSVRPLRRDELPLAVETLTDAFDDDPLFRFFFPKDAPRRRFLRWFHRRALEQCASAGGALTPEDGGPAAGAIGLFPSNRWPLPLARRVVTSWVPTFVPTYELIVHGIALERHLAAHHPRAPHVYVSVLGTHPSRQGRGLGGAMMRHACDLARAARSPLHLETANPASLPFYRRFGLEVGAEIADHGGPPVWTMTRAPVALEEVEPRVEFGGLP